MGKPRIGAGSGALWAAECFDMQTTVTARGGSGGRCPRM